MKKIVVGLLSHYFSDTNLGCVALSICNIILLDRAAELNNIKVEYRILVNEKQKHIDLNFTDNSYKYVIYSSCKESLKHPIKLLKNKCFDKCDVIFNLCAGDGFSDIYGFGRVLSETYMTFLAKIKKCPIVLAPQTIGPFKSLSSRAIAKCAMNKCNFIFTRDLQSTECCKDLGVDNKTLEVIDVALSLPYEKVVFKNNGLQIGINISGLLYRGGYNEKNYFGLNFEYKKFIISLVEKLSKNYTVHLISHVIGDAGFFEDDYTICKEVHQMFPETILAPRFISPIDAKNYIAGLDLFSGARMHATIAAFSSGVPVIPISYSRKFNGLYSNLNYPYMIDAKIEKSVEAAIAKFYSYINGINDLKQKVMDGQEIYKEQLERYCEEVGKIMIMWCK